VVIDTCAAPFRFGGGESSAGLGRQRISAE
jgi:hypothetical protein